MPPEFEDRSSQGDRQEKDARCGIEKYLNKTVGSRREETMSKRRWDISGKIRQGVAASMMVASLLLWSGPVAAQGQSPNSAGSEQNGRALGILMHMANYLAEAPSLSVTIRSDYDAIQESGERIEFGRRIRILLQRPDRLRVDTERSDGQRGILIFDGKEITAFKPGDNVYATVEKPGTVDGALVYLVRDLQVTIPLARLFTTTLPQQMEKLVESVAYVETDALFDVPVDHIAARTAEVDFQFWIAQGEQPLPRRVIITYKNAPGQPQFQADFSDWNFSPQVSAESFVFIPPKGAEKIPFIIPARIPSQAPSENGGAK
jgi:hypothetical protein